MTSRVQARGLKAALAERLDKQSLPRIGPQNYVVTDHPAWRIAAAAREAVHEDPPQFAGDEAEGQAVRIDGGRAHAGAPEFSQHAKVDKALELFGNLA